MRTRLRVLAATSLSAGLLAACAGNGAGLDTNGRPLGSGGSDGGPLTADFKSIQDHVFTPICTVCHAGAGAPQGLRLDAANSYGLLVGVPSNEVPGILRVKPGDPGNSYLIQKLEGHAAVGVRMPLGGPYLDSATIAVIRQWITDGAQRPVAALAAKMFVVVAVAPAPGEVLTDSPDRLFVEFSRELDRTRIDATALRLERVDTVDTGAPGERVPVDLSVPTADPFTLIVTPHAPLPAGRYRLVTSNEPGAGLSDLSGQSLPGTTPVDVARPPLTHFDVGSSP